MSDFESKSDLVHQLDENCYPYINIHKEGVWICDTKDDRLKKAHCQFRYQMGEEKCCAHPANKQK